ncbi:MAG: hypothetical protein L0221_06805 [Chloroflexi bacterium]|nr:hypothetical protein [Chloroflexota bacterium]
MLAIIVYAFGAFVLTVGTWVSPTTHWIGTCCDQEVSIWYLGWLPYALSHGLDPLFTTMLNSPDGVNLMWNSATPPLSALAWLPAAIGGPVFAYNVLVFAAIVLCGVCARAAVARYVHGEIGPFLGGAIYAFSPYVISHAVLHLNLVHAWLPPLFLIVLDELLVRRRRPPWQAGLALGVLSAIQLLIAEELLATSVIAAGSLVIVLALSRRDHIGDGIRRLVPALATATVSFLILGGWPLAHQFFGPQRITEQVQSPEIFSTDLLNLILPTPYQLLAPDIVTDVSRTFSGLYHEATGYIGLPLLIVLAVVAVVRWRDLRIRIATIVGGVLWLLSLGPHLQIGATNTGIPLPWLAIAGLPILEHILPGRLTVFTFLAIGVVVGIVVGETVRLRLETAAPRLFAIGAALLFLLPAPLAATTTEVPAFFRAWSAQGIGADETVLVAPYFTGGAMAHPLVWAAFAGNAVRMPEAYAYVPCRDGSTCTSTPGSALSTTMLRIQNDGSNLVVRGDLRARIALDLQAADVRHVVVGPMTNRDQMVAFFGDLFGRPPEEAGGVSIWRDVDQAGVIEAPP